MVWVLSPVRLSKVPDVDRLHGVWYGESYELCCVDNISLRSTGYKVARQVWVHLHVT